MVQEEPDNHAAGIGRKSQNVELAVRADAFLVELCSLAAPELVEHRFNLFLQTFIIVRNFGSFGSFGVPGLEEEGLIPPTVVNTPVPEEDWEPEFYDNGVFFTASGKEFIVYGYGLHLI